MPERIATLSGPQATHRAACHNQPTAEEAAAGRPLRPGFEAAPPPGARSVRPPLGAAVDAVGVEER
jgi:hypothetical protein